jgi:hypothetical protein
MGIPVNTWSKSQRARISISRQLQGESEQRGDAGHVLTFYNVDFAAIRPRTIFAQRPKGRPSATTRRYVRDIEDNYYLIVRGRTRDPHAVTPARRGGYDGPIVGTHEELPVLH